MNRSPELRIEPAAGVLRAARRWVDGVRAALGPDFVAAYVTGAALTQGFRAARSEMNVLVVARRLDAAALEKLAAAVAGAPRTPRVSPLFLTASQIRSSLDVYPIEFLDLHDHHLLLEGENVLARVRVSRADLRGQCERELRGRLTRLRQTYVLRRRSPASLVDAIGSMADGWHALFRALLRLRGEEVPAHNARVLERVADVFAVPAEGILAGYMLGTGRSRPQPAEIRARYLAFVRAVERLVEALDGLPAEAELEAT